MSKKEWKEIKPYELNNSFQRIVTIYSKQPSVITIIVNENLFQTNTVRVDLNKSKKLVRISPSNTGYSLSNYKKRYKRITIAKSKSFNIYQSPIKIKYIVNKNGSIILDLSKYILQ